jgi:Zn-dependent peptidase ImmA (M78 family)/DNA-binding XRE family transcriptional regulator
MQEHIGHRIKSARKLAGLSLRELAHIMDCLVSHNAISKYERGLMMPDAKVISALAKALQLNTDYFLRPQTVAIKKIAFRKKSTLGKAKSDAILEKVRDIMERYLELESFLNIEPGFENPLTSTLIETKADVEKAANKVLHHWDLGINAIPNVMEMLEDQGIKVIVIDTDQDFDGLSGWANTHPFIVINDKSTTERKRFTALHELGHILLQFGPEIRRHQDQERLCNTFAAAMLLPKDTLFRELGQRRSAIALNELINIKEAYGISLQAIMTRAQELSIITKDQYDHFRQWLNAHEDHRMEKDFGKYPGLEQTTRFKQLLYRATAEDIISMSKAASLANTSLAQFRDDYQAI